MTSNGSRKPTIEKALRHMDISGDSRRPVYNKGHHLTAPLGSYRDRFKQLFMEDGKSYIQGYTYYCLAMMKLAESSRELELSAVNIQLSVKQSERLNEPGSKPPLGRWCDAFKARIRRKLGRQIEAFYVMEGNTNYHIHGLILSTKEELELMLELFWKASARHNTALLVYSPFHKQDEPYSLGDDSLWNKVKPYQKDYKGHYFSDLVLNECDLNWFWNHHEVIEPVYNKLIYETRKKKVKPRNEAKWIVEKKKRLLATGNHQRLQEFSEVVDYMGPLPVVDSRIDVGWLDYISKEGARFNSGEHEGTARYSKTKRIEALAIEMYKNAIQSEME